MSIYFYFLGGVLLGLMLGLIFAKVKWCAKKSSGIIYAIDNDGETFLALEIDKIEDITDKRKVTLDVKSR